MRSYILFLITINYLIQFNYADLIHRNTHNREEGITRIVTENSIGAGSQWKDEAQLNKKFIKLFEHQLQVNLHNFKINKTDVVRNAADEATKQIKLSASKLLQDIMNIYDKVAEDGVPLCVLALNDVERFKSVLKELRLSDSHCADRITKQNYLIWRSNIHTCMGVGVAEGQVFAIEFGYHLSSILDEFEIAYAKSENSGVSDEEIIKNFNNALETGEFILKLINTDRLPNSVPLAATCMHKVITDIENDMKIIPGKYPECFKN